jgi:uncharacterized protein involved in exopolysaccharide biosynthesis
MDLMQPHLKLAPVKCTKLIAISYSGRDPNEAAQILNAIAESYRNYRIETRNKNAISGLKVLQEQFQKETEQLSQLQTNTEQLRQQLKIPDNQQDALLPEQKEYFDVKKTVTGLLQSHRLLKTKILSQQADLHPTVAMVQITDPAEPPRRPIGPNRTLGAVEAALGLLLLCGGVFLLKPA